MEAKDLAPPVPQTQAPSTDVATSSWWSLVFGDVHCVLHRDPAARNLLEAWTIYPGVHAIALHRIAHALWRRGWRYLPRWMSFFARWLTHIDIHPGAVIGARLFIDHGAGIVIGETAVVGDDVTLYHGVTLGGTSLHTGKRHPTLGNQVVVGAGAKILGPIHVGDRVRIAANSVVIEAVPANTTVVGIPGRVVGRSRRSTHGFDLDHHLIPDPVGKAIACLLDRVAQLELTVQAHALNVATPETPCGACDDHCTEPGFKRPHPQTSTPE
jgi:serine O-acetyltransferase